MICNTSYLICNGCDSRIIKSHSLIYCNKCGYDFRINVCGLTDRFSAKILHDSYWVGIYSWPLEPSTHIYAGLEGRQAIVFPYVIVPKIENDMILYKEFLAKIRNILVMI